MLMDAASTTSQARELSRWSPLPCSGWSIIMDSWELADPDVPILNEAKAGYAKLK